MKLLAPSEGLVMKCIWDVEDDLTVTELCKQIEARYQRTYAANTVGTFLNILAKKGFVMRYKIKGPYRYKALITKETYITFMTKTILDEWYDGSVFEAIKTIIKTSNLTKEEANKIKALLDANVKIKE